MDKPKSAPPLSGVHPYWVCYQPKGDPFTHIRYFDKYEDALELYEAVRVLHREFGIPVSLDLTQFPNAPEHSGGSKTLLEQKDY